MNFILPTAIYTRLSGIPSRFIAAMSAEEREMLTCIRLERHNKYTYAIATNRRVAAVYFLGVENAPDAVLHMALDADLLTQCEKEAPFNSTMEIVNIPAIGMANAKTSLGYVCPNNLAKPSENSPIAAWRTWTPSKPIDMTVDAMSWQLDDMIALNKSSPSGVVRFPEFIDANKSVVMNDLKDPNWVGMFMANRRNDEGKPYAVEPAIVPEWWGM